MGVVMKFISNDVIAVAVRKCLLKKFKKGLERKGSWKGSSAGNEKEIFYGCAQIPEI
jgi:hypothetical protein